MNKDDYVEVLVSRFIVSSVEELKSFRIGKKEEILNRLKGERKNH